MINTFIPLCVMQSPHYFVAPSMKWGIVAWWRHQMEAFSALLAICAGNSPVPVNSPHRGQWRGALMSPLICTWINSSVNNREASVLRRNRAHYDVNVMVYLGLGFKFVPRCVGAYTMRMAAVSVNIIDHWGCLLLVNNGSNIHLSSPNMRSVI